VPAVWKPHDGRAEASVPGHLAAETPREGDRVHLDGDVDVEALAPQQDVADGSADEVDALSAGQVE
jgi:hypothetical protein